MSIKQDRLDQTLRILNTSHFLNIGELALTFGVSEMTIRRDVHDLAERGLARIVYGGIASLSKDSDKLAYIAQAAQTEHTKEKLLIARRACEFIAPGDVIFLDSGTTVEQLASQFQTDAAYTLISCSFNTLTVVTRLANCTVIAPGGVFSQRSMMFSGAEAVNTIRKYRANKAFIGATGYEIKHGLTCSYVEDAPVKQAVMESSVEKILLLDSSKFGKVSTCSFASIKEFTAVITDSGIPEEYALDIRAHGSELLIVDGEQ